MFGFFRWASGLQAVTAGATNVTIASADKDLAQLVTRRVNMLNVYTDERLGPEEASHTPKDSVGLSELFTPGVRSVIQCHRAFGQSGS